MKKLSFKILMSFMLFTLFLGACKEEEFQIPTASDQLQNDLIKRSLGPNIVGGTIEFAYAAGIVPEKGKLSSMTVEASIAGATGTYMDNKFYNTNNTGVDVGTAVGDPSTTTGKTTQVVYTGNFSAATLRYYYKIPEEARGKSISFTFTAKASNGETISYQAGPYEIRSMDMQLDLIAKDGTDCFISIADMKVYNATFAAANPDKIDLIYLYRALTNVTYLHSLVAPTADPIYWPTFTMPTGLKNKSKIVKAFTVRDQQLARIQYGVFVDDVDLRSKDFADAPDFAINVKAEGGVWVQTADGKYNAYIYINTVNNTTKEMRISVKRLAIR
ncbi:DUF4466 family protein [Pedobacter chitinilyticus]|uniref:DUF4466 domain-containing protein n=1 Tax=Pedobacter chitinilyticus TaxID=2233776 RepID=A0A3S3QI80_9SPHI|nr:DUF4466 family protein [Pedobacter chitinilyticus]RWU10781.1 DUF4466 domain-containing protein [Pedobacter chitinilyticus]